MLLMMITMKWSCTMTKKLSLSVQEPMATTKKPQALLVLPRLLLVLDLIFHLLHQRKYYY
jgi:hypothetical protein